MNAVSNPSFTMIVSTYQRRDMVCETVQAIGRIAYDGPFELVVIIDGSNDGTEDALKRIELPFPYRVVWQPNGGLGHARNRGAQEARHEILFFLDDDMIVRPDIVEQHAKKYREGADAVLGEIPLEDNSPPGFLSEGIAIWAADSARQSREMDQLTPFHVFGGQLSVRRSAYEAIGGFDARFTENGNYGQEDADFGVKLLERFKVVHAPEAVSLHRYIVTPRENLRRAFKSGRADVMFARRHPSLAPTLFGLNNIHRRITRYVYKPLGAVPLFPKVFAAFAGWFADQALKTRWRSNKWVARVFYAAQQVAYWSAVRRHGGMPTARKALVLCYHAMADHSFDGLLGNYSIPPDVFAAQIASLKRRGFTFITADDLLLCLKGLIRLPKKSVLLTFDDCYTDLTEVVRTVLAPQRIRPVAFAVTGLPSWTNEWDQKVGAVRLQLLDPEGLRELHALGVDIGAHSRTHRMMPDLSDRDLASETQGCADDIEAMGLPRPKYFCYPFGGRDQRCFEAVEKAGYALGFGLADKHARRGKNMMDVARIEMLTCDAPWRFWLKTAIPRPATYLRSRFFQP